MSGTTVSLFKRIYVAKGYCNNIDAIALTDIGSSALKHRRINEHFA
jgi:hypothetical protein